jgi:hypothetical protein
VAVSAVLTRRPCVLSKIPKNIISQAPGSFTISLHSAEPVGVPFLYQLDVCIINALKLFPFQEIFIYHYILG